MKKKNIRKGKEGRFEIQYHYGYKADGTANYRSIYGKSRNEVLTIYHRVINTLIQNNDLLIFDKTYIGYTINNWLGFVKIKNKKSTYSNYQYIVSSRIIPRFAKIKKERLSIEQITTFITDMLNEGLKEKTVKDILIILQQILKFGNLEINFPMPKVPKREIQIFQKEDQAKLEKELLKNRNPQTLGIYLCLYTGLRIGELCALQWKNIDLKEQKIKVKKTLIRIKNPEKNAKKKTMIILDDPKSLSSIREIPIPNFLIPILHELSQNNTLNAYLLSGTEKWIETRTYFNQYKKILKKLDLQNYSFHALRHTFATRCIENGCDPKTLSEILGHASVQITLERYVHPNYENKVRMINQLKPLYQ